MPFFECSAASGENVDPAFMAVLGRIDALIDAGRIQPSRVTESITDPPREPQKGYTA
jgi:hypothetical protein